jgi:hypothetical protein
LRDIPRIGLIECRPVHNLSKPILPPREKVRISILLPDKEALITRFRPPETTIWSLITEFQSPPDDSFVFQSISTREIVDSGVTIGLLPSPRDFFLIRKITVSVCDPSGNVQSVLITERSTFDDLKRQMSATIADRFGFIPDSSQLVHSFGTTFTAVLPIQFIVVRVQIENSPLHHFKFKHDSLVRNLHSFLASFLGVFFEYITLSVNDQVLLDDCPLREVVISIIRVSQVCRVRKSKDYQAELASLVRESGKDPRTCARCFNYHDYDYDAALRDLQRDGRP